ncbi:MAG: adenylate/guanylate cyclase domain-containing protein [Geminicoccaceae bacterium]
MAALTDLAVRQQRAMGPLLVLAVVIGLIALPLAVWMDLRSLSERLLRLQAGETSRIIDDMRSFYASDVVGRVLRAHGAVTTGAADYQSKEGAIPIPATLSIELGKRISAHDGAVRYRFISDLPFKSREPHLLDGFEKSALDRLRGDPKTPVVEVTGSLFDRQVRIATPVLMGKVCVDCHNTHPDSPKTDWKVGDVRGIQEISVTQSLGSNLLAFKYLLTYFVLAAAAGLTFILLQRRQARLIRGINNELSHANDFLAAISMKLAKYLSPQIYKSIFSGQKDVAITTERKKLTIFFSDIENFTGTTERLQPEELTHLLNEYLTEMSKIALAHGATVDKFIGDAILGFFGDPETKGVTEDARACVEMAVAMQQRLAQLNATWREQGIEQPFRSRIGINTGYCNVGNFGSDDRMDYTIIGAEANLAARLQTVAEPNGIVLSYETYALVRDLVRAHPLPAIRMKGISREVVPYAVDGLLGEVAQRSQVISEHAKGLDLFIDLDVIDETAAARTRDRLRELLAALEARAKPA